MLKKYSIVIVSTMLMAISFTALAGLNYYTTSYSSETDTKGYVGLQWLLNETPVSKPNILGGIRWTRTNASNNVNGVDATLTFSTDKMTVNTLRTGYIGGKCDVQGTAGIGYSFINSAALAYAGIVGPYSKVLGQVDTNKKLDLGVELNTQKCEGHRNTVITPLFC
jgi:hypothetical protein